jgi:ribonuclease HI
LAPLLPVKKCNVDGAFSIEDNTGATGVILRDHDGRFLAGRVAWHENNLDAMLMEAMASRESLMLARQCGIARICLETEHLGLVKLWESLHEQRSVVNLILFDIRALSRSFDEFTFVYANRNCNWVAHLCAR